EQLKLYRNNLSRRRHKKTIPKVVSNMLEMLNEITINDTSDKIILSHFRYRQNEWLHLHQNTNLSRRLNSDIAKLLVSHIRHLESVLERKFSILDAIIRCCHQPTLIPKTEKESYVLPIFRFYDTVNILSETKYKSNLIVAFV
ncbi:MAG: hypothetical protein ACM3JQ_04490, partial [Candidatus Eiseniibacteriota bacterium]